MWPFDMVHSHVENQTTWEKERRADCWCPVLFRADPRQPKRSKCKTQPTHWQSVPRHPLMPVVLLGWDVMATQWLIKRFIAHWPRKADSFIVPKTVVDRGLRPLRRRVRSIRELWCLEASRGSDPRTKRSNRWYGPLVESRLASYHPLPWILAKSVAQLAGLTTFHSVRNVWHRLAGNPKLQTPNFASHSGCFSIELASEQNPLVWNHSL